MKLSLPVLPAHITEYASFTCGRRGITPSVGQCVARYQTREDDVCARDAAGELSPKGCPVGAQAVKALEAHEARTMEIKKAKTRRAA